MSKEIEIQKEKEKEFLNKFSDFFEILNHKKIRYTIEYDESKNRFITNVDTNETLIFDNKILPDYLTFLNNYSNTLIIDYPLKTLPHHFKSEGVVAIQCSDKKEFGINTQVVFLMIREANIDLTNVKVEREIDMCYNKYITQLPDGFEINRLLAYKSKLKTLKNVKIKKGAIIRISYSDVDELPDGCVLEELDARCSNLKTLKSATIFNRLTINRSGILNLDGVNGISNIIKYKNILNDKYADKIDKVLSQYPDIKTYFNEICISENLLKLPDYMYADVIYIDFNKTIKKFNKTQIINKINAYNSVLEELPINLIKIINIEHSKISYIDPKIIKNTNKDDSLNIDGLVIENIQELIKLNPNVFKIKILSPNKWGVYNSVQLKSFIKNKKNYDCYLKTASLDDAEALLKNILLCKSKKAIYNKLLLNKFDEIKESEIKTEILKENSKEIKLIDFCQSKEAFDFLLENDYQFTKKNMEDSLWVNKNLYEKYLLLQEIDLKNIDKKCDCDKPIQKNKQLQITKKFI